MKNYRIFGAIVGTIIAMTISSCEKSDKVERFPEGTSMVKMMNEDNGDTRLGNTNVHITSTGNFRSSIYSVSSPVLPILDCGKKDGIGDIGLPSFMNMAPEVAVTPGHGYVICNSDSVLEFPSRMQAIREDAQIYRVYVDSWIYQDGKEIGANVYFLLGWPLERGQMPEMESNIGTLTWDMQSNTSSTISIKLPSEDIEVFLNGNGIITYTTKGRTLTLALSNSPMSFDITDYTIFIRSGSVYTKSVVTIKQDY